MFLQSLLDLYPLVDVSRALTPLYAQINAYSQGKLKLLKLARTRRLKPMGKGKPTRL
jgi:hypothetical protein